MNSRHRFFLLTVLCASCALLTLLAGCVRAPRPVYDQPALPSGYWETAWVEPRIIMADSVFTLIRADRVDSIYVNLDRRSPLNESPSIEFAVPAESCFVSVNLALGNRRGLSYPLIARFLSHGNYKLSVSLPLKLEEFPPREAIELRANVCGKTKAVPIIR